MKLALLIAPALVVAASTPASAADSRRDVLAVDERQRAFVAASDVAALEKLAHPPCVSMRPAAGF